MTATDRYVLRGSLVPVIWPGTLADLTQAMRIAKELSTSLTQVIRLYAVTTGTPHTLVRAYRNGNDITSTDQEDTDDEDDS
jgi:hypothetical protein